MENPIKMDDLGVPLFSETSIYWWVLPLEEKKQIIEVSPSTKNEQCTIGPWVGCLIG